MATKSSGWLIDQLKKKMEGFNTETYPLASSEIRAFKTYYELLKEDASSLKRRSKQRRSARLRVRSLLVDVFFGIGQEVFLLCTLAVSITTLATVTQTGLVSKLREWWKSASHPQGLTGASRHTCGAYSITALFTSLVMNDTGMRRL
ncbi:hypothetical protein K469DRAFT_239323 [Zopfia rhizophila CBS 207.26]|uniref:Uncharacterized protein n=1 Tax=Zopfia rhizophila CBS 207.26 TaxID=1314779 RepID=A0A6A6ESB9_9PEZI|nr:hypothetical protein K469DRAFT_239323 [Zopfia rhizophila CBS 207.26]